MAKPEQTGIGKSVLAIETRGESDRLILKQVSERLDCWWSCMQELKAENAKLKERIKKFEEIIKAALRISDLWTLKEVETMFKDEAKALEAMKIQFKQSLKGDEYGSTS